MTNILILLRTLQLYGQNLHNLASGSTFFADHEALGDFYTAAAQDYDMVVERTIGLGKTIDLKEVHKSVAENIARLPHETDCQTMFKSILNIEKKLCAVIEKECGRPGVSEGTRQLIGEVANKSEGRQYKLGQRLK